MSPRQTIYTVGKMLIFLINKTTIELTTI